MSSESETNKYKGNSSTSTFKKSKHRSRSTPRHNHNDVDKPRKKRNISAANSLASIPNAIKLAMYNHGLIPSSSFSGKLCYSYTYYIFCFFLQLIRSLQSQRLSTVPTKSIWPISTYSQHSFQS